MRAGLYFWFASMTRKPPVYCDQGGILAISGRTKADQHDFKTQPFYFPRHSEPVSDLPNRDPSSSEHSFTALKGLEIMDDFARLGVSPNASPKEIQRARRVLAKVHHPDSAADPKAATKVLSEINASYDRILAGNPIREKAASRPMRAQDFQNFDDAEEPRWPQPESKRPSRQAETSATRSHSTSKGKGGDAPEAKSDDFVKSSPFKKVRSQAPNPTAPHRPQPNRNERVAAAAYAMAKRATSNKAQRPSQGLDITI